MTRVNRMGNIVAIMLAAVLLFPANAMACSIPYVDDVNYWDKHSSIVTLVSLGKEKRCQWKVTDLKTGKRVKVENRRNNDMFHVCTAVMKHKRHYKVSIRTKSHGKWGKWKSIGYCIY